MTGVATELERVDEAMRQIWKQWFSFYRDSWRGPGIQLSMADQMAFYEIAQPILRELATRDQ